MGEKTEIAWTDATFNPWWGCTEVGPGCDNCYAREWAKRFGVRWGLGESRREQSAAYWSSPLAWNRKAAREGVRRRVFCASMADVFDKDGLPDARQRLWRLIEATPHLDWLLLTKRVGNVVRMLPERWQAQLPYNVWLGITVVNQEEVDRDIPKLLAVPAATRFLSCEPLLGPITFEGRWIDYANPAIHENWLEALSWVIVGGESGRKARPMAHEWATDLREQCAAVCTPFFMKQGSQANWPAFKDFESFPPRLQVRQWPAANP